MKPSSATISSMTSCGTGASVVIAITASSERLPSSSPGGWRPDRGGGDVHAVLAERRPDAADHARHVLVAEQRQVAFVHLQVEATAPRLEQVRAVLLAERRPDHARAVAAADDGHAHEVGEVARHGLAALGDLDAALLGQRRRVDEVDLLVGVTGEQAVEDGQGEQARVALGDPAEELDLDPVDARRLRERHPDAPEPARERQERAEHVHVLRAHGRDVDGGRHDAAGERSHDLLGRLHAGAVLRLGRRGREVRRDDDVGVAEQRVVGDRLVREDVERDARDLARSRAPP